MFSDCSFTLNSWGWLWVLRWDFSYRCVDVVCATCVCLLCCCLFLMVWGLADSQFMAYLLMMIVVVIGLMGGWTFG